MKLVTAALLLLIALVQADLWFGKGGLSHVVQLRSQLKTQERSNAEARLRNQRLAAEIDDLRQGLEMVEEKARSELGMVRPDEILVQLGPRKP